ncbi:MAG TPA: sigma-70 family RNA polymerase sigma factor [Gemmataceae bacterium]|nr:sigma-70 family RNA polymerase sigma factor [Gemmataceae bacterium]
MSEQTDFEEFVRRIRAGDQRAAAELVDRVEPLIRREIRLRIRDASFNRVFDSLDVCQSVLASFFFRAANGEYVLERPDQLVGLLVTMARNRLISRTRKERSLVRDIRRLVAEPEALDSVADSQPSPSQMVERNEQIHRIRELLTDEEWRVFELRTEGVSWDKVAATMGGSAPSRRMQLSRALARLERQLSVAD